ncbi:MAG TPA: hypothetical protein VMR52_07510 [Dehalococcoidia bacterium]|nr:hypothetical protein [Dehalococcoidia bacterium]
MDDDDGPRREDVTSHRCKRLRKPLSAWLASAIYVVQTAAEQVAQTAALLIASALVVWQTVAWRGQASRR